jgi:hypothetical protein
MSIPSDPSVPAPGMPGPIRHNNAGAPFPRVLDDSPRPKGTREQRKHRKLTLFEGLRYAQQLGWIPYFRAAAQRYAKNSVTTELLISMAYHESWLDPRYLLKPGDSGHAFGLMAIDKRFYAPWVNTGDWHDAKKGIDKGAEVLAEKHDEIQRLIGKVVKIGDLKAIGKPIEGRDLLRVSVACYNAGRKPYYRYSVGQDIDMDTHQHNYSHVILDQLCWQVQLYLGALQGDFFLDGRHYA